MSMQEGKLPKLSYSPTKIPALTKQNLRFEDDMIRESFEVENPFQKDATFGGKSFTATHLKASFEEHD